MKSACLLLAAALVTTYSASSAGQSFPSKPVRIIVPFAAGGNVDLVARGIAQRLSEGLGQQVIVDNRPGSSGLLGTHLVAKAAPDGYTVLAMANTFAVVPSIMSNPGYDPLKDFAGVSQTCLVPQVLVVNPALPVRSVKELVALAKARPGEMSYASAVTLSKHLVPADTCHLFHGPVPGDDQTSFIHSECGIRQEINDIGQAPLGLLDCILRRSSVP